MDCDEPYFFHNKSDAAKQKWKLMTPAAQNQAKLKLKADTKDFNIATKTAVMQAIKNKDWLALTTAEVNEYGSKECVTAHAQVWKETLASESPDIDSVIRKLG